MSRRASKKVCLAPMAVASDGNLLLNIAHTHGPSDPQTLLDRAIADGRPIFIGVALTSREVALAKRWTDESSAELVGTLWGTRQRRRLAGAAVARRIRKTPS